jgi:hypothetical protein
MDPITGIILGGGLLSGLLEGNQAQKQANQATAAQTALLNLIAGQYGQYAPTRAIPCLPAPRFGGSWLRE